MAGDRDDLERNAGQAGFRPDDRPASVPVDPAAARVSELATITPAVGGAVDRSELDTLGWAADAAQERRASGPGADRREGAPGAAPFDEETLDGDAFAGETTAGGRSGGGIHAEDESEEDTLAGDLSESDTLAADLRETPTRPGDLLEAPTRPGDISEDATVGPRGSEYTTRPDPEGGAGGGALRRVADPERYRREAEIARGGIGRIVEAVDEDLGRRVALKEVLRDIPALSARFEREALITARLQHPGIVPVYEAGRWPDGAPFFAMKRVDGRPLDEVIGEVHTPDQRLGLLHHAIAVADALGYAHDHGVVHRDLKPQNVLVGAHGETVVIDWGLARALDRADEEGPATWAPGGEEDDLTMVGAVLGTPAYMPPEQARGEAVDARADVYALGTILYQLLSGETPYRRQSSMEVLEAVRSGPPPALADRAPAMPRDLVAIVDKAMAWEPADRYADAGALAAELRRFQTGQLVGAHDYTFWELVRRQVARHRAAVSVGAVALVALIGLGMWTVREVVGERDRAEEARGAAEVARDAAVGARSDAERATRRAEERFDELSVVQAESLLGSDPTASVARILARHDPERRWRQARTIAADAIRRGVAARVMVGHRDRVRSVAVSRDGGRIVSAGYDGEVRVWDRGRDGSPRVLAGHADKVRLVDLTHDARWVASAGLDGRVGLWDADTGDGGLLDGHQDELRVVAFSPDGSRLASAGKDAVVRVWDVANRRGQALRGHQGRVRRVAWSPDGRRLATGAYDGLVLVWDLEAPPGSPPITVATHEDRVRSVRWSADGRWIASAGRGPEVRADPAPGLEGEAFSWGPGSGQVNGLAFGAAGSPVLAASDEAGLVRVWSLDSGALVARWELGVRTDSVKVAPDGRRVVTASQDGVVRVLGLDGRERLELRGFEGATDQVMLSEDGRFAVAGSWDHTVRAWWIDGGVDGRWAGHEAGVTALTGGTEGGLAWSGDAAGRVVAWAVGAHRGRDVGVVDGAVSVLTSGAGGRWIAAGTATGRVQAWQPGDQGRASASGAGWDHRGAVRDVSLAGDGWLASGGVDGAVWVGLADGGGQERVVASGPAVHRVAWSPGARRLAFGTADGTVGVWQRSGGTLARLQGHHEGVFAVAFSPDGARLATAGEGERLAIWTVASGVARWLPGHQAAIRALAWSPDGSTVATASDDQTVRLWDAEGGRARVLRGHGTALREVAWAPHGRSLVTLGEDGAARLWDAATGRSRSLGGASVTARGVAWLADGDGVALARGSIVARAADDLPWEPEALVKALSGVTAARLDEAGEALTSP